MAILDFLGKFFAVVGSIWMLAVAYKIVGDTWDALFSKKYKKWLARFTQTGKSHLHKTSKKLNKIIDAKKATRKSVIFPIKKETKKQNVKGVKRGNKRDQNKRNKGNNRN